MAAHQLLMLIGLFLSLMVTSCNGWWFLTKRYTSARANGKAVDEECLAKANEGSCDFYTCFEDRLRCGGKWYNKKYGAPYCRDFEVFGKNFSPEGQIFLNATQKCMTQELVNWYQRGIINCHAYTHFAFKALARCFMKNDFCSVVRTDVVNFVSLFRPKHLFQSGAAKIWRTIVKIVYHCEPDSIQRFLSEMWKSLNIF